ncbi:MAG: pitrilysin family protein [Lentisphaerota bacterium]
MRLNFEESRLDNGLRVVTVNMPQVESVAMGVWVGVGGRHEQEKYSGVSHFIEHLLFKGTKTRSARAISEAIEGRGGYFNAFTQEESTCYYARISSEHLWSVFHILADMYMNPRFDEKDLNKERGVIIEEIMMYRDQPQHVAQENLGRLLWVNHPLGRPLIGTVDNIEKLSRRDILAFKERYYVPACTLVVFAGKVQHGECVERVSSLMKKRSKGLKPSYKLVTPATRQRSISVAAKDIEQTQMAMGLRLFGRHDKRKYPLKLMSIILGENMSSRLFQIVREKHGLAYSISSSLELFDETGLLGVQAGVDRRNKIKALRLVIKELKRMKQGNVTASELRRAKDYSIGQLRIGLESTTNQMMWAGENIMSYGRFYQPDEIIRLIQGVTAEQIQETVSPLLRPDRLSVAMVCPEGEEPAEAEVRDCLSEL